MTAPPPAVGFLGAGQMATALARGWAAAGETDPARCLASDVHPPARAAFAAATGVPATPDNLAVVRGARVLVLAVKPQTLPALAAEVRPHLTADHLVVSIAAGVTLATLAGWFGGATRLVRVMPNTPCLVGVCAAGVAPGPTATPADAEVVMRLFAAVGRAVVVPESLLDAVTGVSGSGPAFVYMLIEAMADGGVRAGLSRPVALELAAQTALGAAKMVLETGTHPATLKDAVASPGGTTIAGIYALERGGFRAAVLDAVAAAAGRAAELGRPPHSS